MKQDFTNEFDGRFEKRCDELKWLYFELYNNDRQGYDYLLNIMKKQYADRDELLKNIDRQKEKTPYWYRSNDIVGMIIYVDNFAEDIKGVIKKIDYFIESGINYVHLMPLLESPKENSDGGYAVSDFQNVQPQLGTMKELFDLTKLFHEHGISCCLDFVMNHTSNEHEWAKAALEGDENARSHYYFYDSWDIPNYYETTVPQVFPTTAPGNFTQLDNGEIVLTTFYPYQWDLNYSNPMVFNDMVENLLFLANQGIDVLRLDAVPYIWKQLGTSCRNLPQVHSIIRMMRLICEIVCPSVLLLGEVVMEPSKVAPYFGTKDRPECHMLYNVTTMASIWNTVATRDTRLLQMQIEKVYSLPDNCVFLNYIRCHDDIGWGLDYNLLRQYGMEEIPHKKYLNDYFTGRWKGSPSRGELYNDDPVLQDARLCGTTASLCGIEAALWDKDEKALAIAVSAHIMLHACIFTLSGIPLIYSGDEIGQLNDYMYHADINKKFDSRYLHRGKFDWELAQKRLDPDSYQGIIFNALKKLEVIRRDNDVFEPLASVSTFDTGTQNVLGLYRVYCGQTFMALFNFCEGDRDIIFDKRISYTDLLTGKKHKIKHIELKPYEFIWALIK